MEGWTADFVNHPDDDFNLMVEICLNGKDVALIYCDSTNCPTIKWYPHQNDFEIPVEWLCELLAVAAKSLRR